MRLYIHMFVCFSYSISLILFLLFTCLFCPILFGFVLFYFIVVFLMPVCFLKRDRKGVDLDQKGDRKDFR